MIDAVADHRRTRPRWLLAALIVFTVACALLFVPSVAMAVTSPMLSDAGLNAAIWALIAGSAVAPVVLLVSPIVASIGYGIRRKGLALAALAAPLVWLVYMTVSFLLVDTMPRQ